MQLLQILKDRDMSRLQLARQSNIAPSDLYLAINGKKPFYPKWRQRVAECLQMNENEIFNDFGEVESNGKTCIPPR